MVDLVLAFMVQEPHCDRFIALWRHRHFTASNWGTHKSHDLVRSHEIITQCLQIALVSIQDFEVWTFQIPSVCSRISSRVLWSTQLYGNFSSTFKRAPDAGNSLKMSIPHCSMIKMCCCVPCIMFRSLIENPYLAGSLPEELGNLANSLSNLYVLILYHKLWGKFCVENGPTTCLVTLNIHFGQLRWFSKTKSICGWVKS